MRPLFRLLSKATLIVFFAFLRCVAQAAVPEPAGWYGGDIHAHRNCGGGTPESVSSIYSTMVSQDLSVVSLLADMGNGEVQTPSTDLPLVNGQDASVSTPGRIVHWDAEWHWDATYTQYPHQALGGHIVALGLTSAQQVWDEMTSSIFDWAHQRGGIAGFAHFQYLDDNFPTSLSCCTPVEYPVEVALGACDFISEDVNGSDSFIHAYYRLLNCGFRPGFAAGSDHPCAADIGPMVTYSQCAGNQLTYSNWLQGIKNGRTVVSRNGRTEFVDLKANTSNGPGDEIKLTGGGNVQVSITWTATNNQTGTLELVRNGVVIASQAGTARPGTPITLTTSVNFTNSGWLCARRMGNNGHTVHTAAVFVTVDNKPVRASAGDAQFYVQWMDSLLQNTSKGGVWNSYFPTELAAAQDRFTRAKALYQQIATEAGATQPSPVMIGNGNDGGSLDNIWGGGAWINAGRFQASSNMTAATMRAKVAAVAGHYKCAIYSDSGGSPSAFLRGTAEVANTGGGWQSFPLTSSLPLTSGTFYWLAIWSDDPNAAVYYSDNAGTLRWGQYTYGNWPPTLTTSGGGNFKYCLYASGAAASLTSIAVIPANPAVLTGASQQFTATGTYSDGSTQNITSQASWSSANTTVATVDAAGLVTALTAGTSTISATAGGVTGSTLLTVQPGALTITTASLPNGTASVVYSGTLVASGGSPPCTWSIVSGSLPPGLNLNTSSGAIGGTPTAAGTFTFTAQVQDAGTPAQMATKALGITVMPVLSSISVTPVSPSFMAGTTLQLTATGTYSDSSTRDVTSQATWVSSNTVVASVSASGLVTGVSAGATTITAVMDAVSGSTTATILPQPAGLGDYRSVASGTWNIAATWETNNGAAWVAASRPPTNSSSSGVITIRSGHTVTIASAVTVDQVVVQAGGQITVTNVTLTVANGTGTDLDVFGNMVLSGSSGVISVSSGASVAFESGATYQHSRSGGTIPTAAWNANSICLVTGSTTALPGGLGQTFGNLTWNCASQTANLSLETNVAGITGNLTVISTGSGTLRVANGSTARILAIGGDFVQSGGSFVVVGSSGAGTLNVGRNFTLSGGTFALKQNSGTANLNVVSNYNQTGGTFSMRPSNGSGSATVTVSGNYALTAGTFNMSSVNTVGTLNVAGNFTHTGGTITETSSGSGAIVFNGPSPQTYASGGTIANGINFTVNPGATLLMGTQLLGNGSIGTFTLSSGATLGIGDSMGISTSGATGNIRVTGSRTFNSGANYIYNGAAPQVPGTGLPAVVNNLTIATAGGLALNTTNTVNGTCLIASGAKLLGTGRIIDNGPLILNGTIAPGAGAGRFTSAAQIWKGGAAYEMEIADAAGAPGTGWDLLGLTSGQGIDFQATAQTPFNLKLFTLNGASPGLAANFNKTNNYTWPLAITTNASVTNFALDKFAIDTTQFSNDFSGGTFSLEQSGQELRLKFTGILGIPLSSLPDGTVGSAYTATLTAAGGKPAYTWSLTGGALPPGLALDSVTGVIAGIPTSTGTFNATLQVSDSSTPQQTASRSFSLTIAPMLVSIAVTPPNPTILAGSSQQFTATGTYSDNSSQNVTSQATWTSSSSTVATIDSSGLCMAVSPGNTTIRTTLNGVNGTMVLTVLPAPLGITTASLPNGMVNVAYSANLAGSGGTLPYTWALAGGALPTGLSLNTGGSIGGAPTATGTFSFTAKVTDSDSPAQSVTKSMSIAIAAAPPTPPLLVITNAGNPFSQYYSEILQTEGLNEFAMQNITSVSSATLSTYDVVILGEGALTATQVSTLTDWVNAGGKLIAMRPDKQLAGLLGLVDAASTLRGGYLLVNTSGPGAGIVAQTIQYHGTADRYTPEGASIVATLYSDALTATVNPAVTLRNVGANGGEAAAFTYDLARSIVYMRQGNPAWAAEERDGQTPIRPIDLFFGAASFDPQADWVDLDKVAIPQADEQQRLLANMILSMNSSKKLLPRFWYFPHGYKAVVVMTGDDHAGMYGGSYSTRRFDQYLAASPAGGSVDDWTVPRCTSYMYVSPTPALKSDAQAAAYNAAGFEIGAHLDTGCANYTPSALDSFFTSQMGQFTAMFPSLPAQTTHRIHCLVWSDYTMPASVSRSHGIRLETSYYYWPPTWINDRPGFFTGSGMPMRFATAQGNTLDVYQATTQMTDESGQSYPYTVDTLLDRALGPEGYYGAFVANMHTDYDFEPGADAVFSSAVSHSVPIISARQLLTWLDARNASLIKSVSWNSGSESFSVQANAAARGLGVMVPVPGGYQVNGVAGNGSPITYSTVVIKGIQYAFFEAGSADYVVSFGLDTTPPTMTGASPANGTVGVSVDSPVTVFFSKAMNPATLTTSTMLLRDPQDNPVAATVTYNDPSQAGVLTPSDPLKLSTTYTVTVKGAAGGVADVSGNVMSGDVSWSFTTASGYSIWSGTAVPGVVDGGPDMAVELGVKFKSDVAGSIRGIRFYKAGANTGTHVANVWSSTGTRLATATFNGETASGWQQVSFTTPVSITANTVYVASYHCNSGHYSADEGYFSGAGVDNPPLHALADGVSGGNGVYRYGSTSAFPNQAFNTANYWVDVVFIPSGQ